jgi:apolipoprotein N-acyltransferase
MLLTFGLALAGSLLLWLAFPPVDAWPLAWIAPLPWLWLVRLPRLPSRRPYLLIWLASLIHWLLLLEGIRRAHPALYGGWIALSAYVAVYLPLFIGLTRVAVHRLRISLIVAAPVAWVGLEFIRGHLLTGFSLALLAHTQVNWTALLQISDLAGAYAVSFVLMFVAACLLGIAPTEQRPRWTLWPTIAAGGVLVAVLGYGNWRLGQTPPGAARQSLRIALIQGSLDTVFGEPRVNETFEHYGRITEQARRENQRLDLVVWPESMFVIPEPVISLPLSRAKTDHAHPDELLQQATDLEGQFQAVLAGLAGRINTIDSEGTRQSTPTQLIIGTTSLAFGPKTVRRTYNSTLLIDSNGQAVGRYYKMHPVMFGEYIPLGDSLPWIYSLTPMAGGLSVGDGPKVFRVGELNLSPSICFESVVPHLIRGQVVELQRRKTPADVLVNVTNDGWFWGSAILDLHFRCGIFRAVENRKPLIIAANTGISASINGNGRVRLQGGRRTAGALVVNVHADGRMSPYHTVGDWPAWFCGAAVLALTVIGWRKAKPLEEAPDDSRPAG